MVECADPRKTGKMVRSGSPRSTGSSEVTVGSCRSDPLPAQCLQREGRERGVFLWHISRVEASAGAERPRVDFNLGETLWEREINQ